MSDQQSKEQLASAKEVDAAVAAVLGKVQAVKGALSAFVGKMEHEQLTWPSVLDSFTSVSGHMSTLMRQLGSEKIPSLHNRIVLPLQVSSEKDFELERATEGRVPMFHHEILPHYLRTKLDLDLEARQRELIQEVGLRGEGLKGEVAKFNEILSATLDRVNEAKEELEDQRAKANASQPNMSTETRKLVAAYINGQGLTSLSTPRRAAMGGPKSARVGGAKAPSTVKTELRHTANMAMAPYPTSSPLKNR